MPAGIPGFMGDIHFDDLTLCVMNCTVTDTADDLDETTNCDGPYEDGDAGIRRIEVSGEAQWDAGGSGDPPDLYAGDIVDLAVYAGKTYHAPKFQFLKWEHKFEAKGLITYSFSGKSRGVYYTNGFRQVYTLAGSLPNYTYVVTDVADPSPPVFVGE